MELSSRDLRVVLETMMDAGDAADAGAFARVVLDGVDRLIGSDIRTYNVIDLRRGSADVITRPQDALAPAQLDRFAQLTHQHPLIGHFQRRPSDARALAISDFLSRRALHATELHRDFFAQLAIEDQLAINLPTSDGTVVGIALNRPRRSFTPRERAILELLRPQIARSLESLRERRRAAAVAEALERAADDAGEAIVLLRHGRVEHVSARAEALLGGSLPPAAAAALAAGLDPPMVVEHGGRRLGLALLRGEVDVLVIRERAEPVPGHGLTTRELTVLEHVRAGLADREIADALRISPRTVHHHLQNVYAKLGVRSRTAALAMVFGPASR